MKKLLPLGLLLPLIACAGRIPDPVEVEQAGDFYLPCSVIEAEMVGNRDKESFIAERQVDKRARNIGVGVLGFMLFQPAYIGLNLSDADEREMAALDQRRDHLTAIGTSKGCHLHGQVPSGYTVYTRAQGTYEDPHGRRIDLPMNHYGYTDDGARRIAARDPALPRY